MAKKSMTIKLSKVWQGADGQWYFHGASVANGELVLPTQGYASKQKAEQTRQRYVTAVFVLDE
jgi:hypothetical protein